MRFAFVVSMGLVATASVQAEVLSVTGHVLAPKPNARQTKTIQVSTMILILGPYTQTFPSHAQDRCVDYCSGYISREHGASYTCTHSYTRLGYEFYHCDKQPK